ncbi:hypothetical protein BZA05DRAFT_137285 [Tricharina praecox]|uniref:uncharacterized protein n=1 Tax=Tricharina praecox TaxID=43433 RepID=UPI00222069F5|nr:uncharacterized protein BZA05DRAFT_137285 [Tricharina praecox]KAI5846045.1 hypothetical protein BZA05DRAFT_137285 [Tricharina praecox]
MGGDNWVTPPFLFSFLFFLFFFSLSFFPILSSSFVWVEWGTHQRENAVAWKYTSRCQLNAPSVPLDARMNPGLPGGGVAARIVDAVKPQHTQRSRRQGFRAAASAALGVCSRPFFFIE